MKPLLIGIGYKKGSGKDTFAGFLGKHCDMSFATLHFADALKEECSAATGVELYFMNKDKEVFRPLLQWWGTEFRKKYLNDQNYWVHKLDETIKVFERLDTQAIFIPDVRFMNEVNYIKRNGGILIHVTRSTTIHTDQHASECELDTFTGWDYTIKNNGPLERLEDSALGMQYVLNTLFTQLQAYQTSLDSIASVRRNPPSVPQPPHLLENEQGIDSSYKNSSAPSQGQASSDKSSV